MTSRRYVCPLHIDKIGFGAPKCLPGAIINSSLRTCITSLAQYRKLRITRIRQRINKSYPKYDIKSRSTQRFVHMYIVSQLFISHGFKTF